MIPYFLANVAYFQYEHVHGGVKVCVGPIRFEFEHRRRKHDGYKARLAGIELSIGRPD